MNPKNKTFVLQKFISKNISGSLNEQYAQSMQLRRRAGFKNVALSSRYILLLNKLDEVEATLDQF